jgi:protein phosphatase
LRFGALDNGGYYAVVCDGMGGANGGNVASNIAVDVISARIVDGFANGAAPRPDHLLESAMAAANIEIFDKAQSDATYEGMGTTVVAVIVLGKDAYISHVGDSRVYLYRDGAVTQVTRDHSVVQEMIESGQLTEEQARSHPRKHVITRALGVSVMEEGEFDELELEPTDKLLLCTDGLTNMVDDGSLSELLHNSATVDILIQSALDGGGTDNITAVLMEQGE